MTRVDLLRIKGPRNVPQQARSRARLEAVLTAAIRILDAGGVEALTMRRIAEEAGVPAGTVYHFFDDKAAVLATVSRYYLRIFALAMADLLERAAAAPWTGMVDVIFDEYVDLYRRHPGYLAIRTGRHLTPDLVEVDEANNDFVADGVLRILRAQENLLDSPELRIAARAGVHAVDAVLQLAFKVRPQGDPATLAAARRIGRLYLADVVADPRYRQRAL